MTKAALRKQIKQRMKALTADRLQEISVAVCERLRGMVELYDAAILALYAPLAGEIDLMPFARERVAAGALAFPRFQATTGVYELAEVADLDNDFVRGRYGVLEPRQDVPALARGDRSMAWLVPGIAFDPDGNRLGRGGGFYDRLLRDSKKTIKIGIACECQLVSHIPVDDHDIPVDVVVTEEQRYDCRAAVAKE